MRTLDLDGLRLNVRETGDGPPVCLITGIGANVEWLAPFQDSLVGHRAIAFDAPGAGYSDLPTVPMSIKQIAALAARLLRELGHERVDVIGYSFGGTVAQQIAHDFPSQVRRLVLVATSCGWGAVPGDPLAIGAVMTPLRYYSRAVHDLTLPWMGDGRSSEDPELLRRQSEARESAPPPWQGYFWQSLAFSSWSSWPWLELIEQPTLVVVGERDRLIPPVNGEILAARLPHARLVVVSDEGHHFLAVPETPELSAIREFLAAPSVEGSDAWKKARTVHSYDAFRPGDVRNPIFWPLSAASALWRRALG